MTTGDNVIASDASFEFSIAKSLYTLLSVRNTIYKYAADFFIELKDSEHDYLLTCKLKSESVLDTSEVVSFKDIFLETLNDECLRETIRNETAEVRQLIIASTFSGLINGQGNESS